MVVFLLFFSSFLPPTGRVFLQQRTKWPSNLVKRIISKQIKYVLTRSLFSANLLSLIDVSLTASTLPPFFVLKVNLSPLLFLFMGRQFEGVAYFTSWRFALRVVYFRKPLRPLRGVHSMTGYISIHFLLEITHLEVFLFET